MPGLLVVILRHAPSPAPCRGKQLRFRNIDQFRMEHRDIARKQRVRRFLYDHMFGEHVRAIPSQIVILIRPNEV